MSHAADRRALTRGSRPVYRFSVASNHKTDDREKEMKTLLWKHRFREVVADKDHPHRGAHAAFWCDNHEGWGTSAGNGTGLCYDCGGGEETPEMREEKGYLHGRRGPTRAKAPRKYPEAYRRGWIRGARERRNKEAARTAYETDPRGEIGAAYGRGFADGKAEASRQGDGSLAAPDGGVDEAAAYAAGYEEGEMERFLEDIDRISAAREVKEKRWAEMFFLRRWAATAPEWFPRWIWRVRRSGFGYRNAYFALSRRLDLRERRREYFGDQRPPKGWRPEE